MQIRPCFLVIDAEHASSISTRKLVLETAKYNVITAYSCEEADVLLQRFPNVSAVVINGATHDHCVSHLLEPLCELPNVKLLVVGDGPMAHGPRKPDVLLESFAPARLLEVLQGLFPAESRQLLDHESDLERNQV